MSGSARAAVGALADAVEAVARRLARASGELSAEFGALWRRSLQLRVVLSTVALSSSVVLVLGLVLQTQIADRLLQTKTDAARLQTEDSRGAVAAELGSVDPSGPQLVAQLTTAVERLRGTGGSGDAAATAGAFEVVLADGGGPAGAVNRAVGPVRDVPEALRIAVERGAVANKVTTVEREGGAETMLVYGGPVASAGRDLQLYLLFPLSAEQRTLALVQSTLVVGGLVLLVLVAGIASLVTRQVVTPVRQAAEVAVRFAGGDLAERMPVVGEDDMARLGTSFNELAESVQRQIRQLEEFGELQRRFTSDVSHELRTPLTTVRMAAEIIHDARDEMGPALQRSSELLVAELDRFEALLGDLLEISRLDAGVADLLSETVDVRATVRSAAESVRALAERIGGTVQLQMPAAPVLAEIDPRRVERIVRNLLANGLDHGEGRPVVVQVTADDDAVAVLVRDSGVGLRPGEADLVFTRFWRADPSRNRRTGGTGLGLSISLQDAELHGGWLHAWGEPGVGAAFRLTLPRRRDVELAASPLPLGPPSGATVVPRPPAAPVVPAAPAVLTPSPAVDPGDRPPVPAPVPSAPTGGRG